MSRPKTAEDYDRQIEALKQRKKQLLAKQRQQERKARNHALIVMGAMVESACGGDWKAIDLYDLDSYLRQWRKALRKQCQGDADSLEDAKAHVREFEQWQRERSLAEREETRRMVDEVLGDER